jgi:hypothetical protein
MTRDKIRTTLGICTTPFGITEPKYLPGLLVNLQSLKHFFYNAYMHTTNHFMLMYLKVRKLLLGQIASYGGDDNSIVKLLKLWNTSLSTCLTNILLREEEIA